MLNFQRRFITKLRFAPSPTGKLHVGGLKTILLNYLFAKSHNGKFIFRLEDTDRNRLVPGSVEYMLKVFDWFNIDFDEGVTNGSIDSRYMQSNRLDIYNHYVEKLMGSGQAYRCFCSKERLAIMRKEQMRRNEVPGYDGNCLYMSESEVQIRLDQNAPYSVRLNRNKRGRRKFEDLIHGGIEMDNCLDYPIVMKSDGYPTYHLANVVDDHEMQISHVIRGQEWLASTATHLALYEALGWQPPQYGHVPLLLSSNGSKISKRDSFLDHSEIYDLGRLMTERGFAPEVVKVWLMSAGNGLDIPWTSQLTWHEVMQHFSISHLARHSARLEKAQLQMTGHAYWQRLEMTQQYFTEVIHPYLERHDHADKLEYSKFETIFPIIRHRIKCLSDLLEYSYLWQPIRPDVTTLLPGGMQQQYELVVQYISLCLHTVRNITSSSLSSKSLYQELQHCHTQLQLSKKLAFSILRTVLINKQEGQSVQEILELMSQQDVEQRLQASLDALHTVQQQQYNDPGVAAVNSAHKDK